MKEKHAYVENNPGIDSCATCGKPFKEHSAKTRCTHSRDESCYKCNPLVEANRQARESLKHLTAAVKRKSIVESAAYELGFRAGWNKGYADGGEHDCRMFTPTEQRAWELHVAEKLGLSWRPQYPNERAASKPNERWICTNCGCANVGSSCDRCNRER